MRRCARVGGLKEESRMYRVEGGCRERVWGILLRTRKVSEEEEKDDKAVENLVN
jgi:hypothetical protein